MHQASNAYARTSQAGQSPRELEATVLMRAASRLQMIHDDWEGKRADLGEALAYNRKLWTILVTGVTNPENPVPFEIQQNIVNLGLFTFNRTIDLELEPEAKKLTALVNINREIAAGLRASPQPQAA